jgi:hypothetical protein
MIDCYGAYNFPALKCAWIQLVGQAGGQVR